MPISGDSYVTTKENVDKAYDGKGVYTLHDKDYGLIYVGMSDVSIRSRLQRHHSGDEGSCTEAAWRFKQEPNDYPYSRESELIEEYKTQNGGKLPKCNDVSP